MERACKLCGILFTAKSAKKKHCSDSCRDRDRYHSNYDARERKKQSSMRWFYAHYERMRATQKTYYQTHYTDFAERNFARRDRSLPANLVSQILEEENYTCQYCGQYGGKLTIDHKLPVSRNGSDERSNLCVACHRCNCRKGKKTSEEFVEYLASC
jgi:5-methylcytosine-specific restriction endonuclease McrA